MRVLVFGNPLVKIDSAAVKIAKKLTGKTAGVDFVRFDTSEDLEKEGKELVILDAVVGLSSVRIVKLEELEVQKAYSLHDFDLGWNLLLLRKMGKIKKATIIGVPAKRPIGKSLGEVKRLLLKLLHR